MSAPILERAVIDRHCRLMHPSFRYKDAGVDIDAANRAAAKIREIARTTFTPAVLGDVGGFAGMFSGQFEDIEEPVILSSTDGVGTKLKVAFMMGRYDTVGVDLVNHCVNDIFVHGARPLFFLDYIATCRLDPNVIVSLVEGIAKGCRDAGCALIGGETAEMPGFYAEGEFDVAGFIVGVAERRKIIDGKGIRPGDLLIGLPAVGLHTNGYSLARNLFFEVAGWQPDTLVDELGVTAGTELLKPHPNYEPLLRDAVVGGFVGGLAHITGGGITENLARVLPAGCQAEVQLGSWPVLPVFQLIARLGQIERNEMLRATNMGIGMVAVVRPANQEAFTESLDTPYFLMGRVTAGDRRVVYRA